MVNAKKESGNARLQITIWCNAKSLGTDALDIAVVAAGAAAEDLAYANVEAENAGGDWIGA